MFKSAASFFSSKALKSFLSCFIDAAFFIAHFDL